jgi:hypothetical protein
MGRGRETRNSEAASPFSCPVYLQPRDRLRSYEAGCLAPVILLASALESALRTCITNET